VRPHRPNIIGTDTWAGIERRMAFPPAESAATGAACARSKLLAGLLTGHLGPRICSPIRPTETR